jgi:hypothetical protein
MGKLLQRYRNVEAGLSFFSTVIFRTRLYTCHDGIFSGFLDQGMICSSVYGLNYFDVHI